MAIKYALQPNEVVLLKSEAVMHGGRMASYTDELILTNLHLVLLKKGIFGNSKGVHAFPLSEIKVHNGRAQAALGKSSTGFDALEVYFLNGQEAFSFQSGGKKRIREWVNAIDMAVTGADPREADSPRMAVPGTDVVAGVLRDTFTVFKSKFAGEPAQQTKVATKCSACGAPLTGQTRSTVTCQYCGSAQQL